MARLATMCLLGFVLVSFAACGGGGGGDDGGDGGTPAGRTTITGNLASATAAAEPSTLRAFAAVLTRLVATAHAQTGVVEVCVEQTTFCTVVDADGFFTLAADVGGDVTLVFTGPDFVARVALSGIPLGATVRLRNIRCSTVTGTCDPEEFEIDGGDETRSPIRCEKGSVTVSHPGVLVIQGNGDDCIRTAGQCAVTIEADRIVLAGCETCVRTSGGSDVTILADSGGFECTASDHGLRAAGNSAIHVDVAGGGDVAILAQVIGVRSEGTALIELDGDVCRVEGGDDALRINGNASIDTSGCADVDLVGDVDDEDDDDDDDDEDDDD